METGQAAQKRAETMEAMRSSLMAANAHSIAGDYEGSAIAMLAVKSAMGVVRVLDEGDE